MLVKLVRGLTGGLVGCGVGIGCMPQDLYRCVCHYCAAALIQLGVSASWCMHLRLRRAWNAHVWNNWAPVCVCVCVDPDTDCWSYLQVVLWVCTAEKGLM